MAEEVTPIFLGVSTRVLQHVAGWDIERCTTILSMPFFPNSVNGSFLIFAFPQACVDESLSLKLWLRGNPEKAAGHHSVILHNSAFEPPISDPVSIGKPLPSEFMDISSFTQVRFANLPFLLFPVPSPPLNLNEPDEVIVEMKVKDKWKRLGSFWCVFSKPAPIDEKERKDLLRRDRRAHNTFEMTCNVCSDSLKSFLSLDPEYRPRALDDDYVPLMSAPDPWACKCGANSIPTRYLKSGFHDKFRLPPRVNKFFTRYESDEISRMIKQYRKLINGRVGEEVIQNFLEDNEILWSFLGPIKIISKPPMLTKKRADFGVLTASRTLYLVEIERPQTVLAKRKGGQNAELQQGLDQINDWRVIVSRDRRALLSELDIREEDVHSIKFVLVAGLSAQTNQDDLYSIRSGIASDTVFHTFDELADLLEQFQYAKAAL